jgi:hypothetical protein
MPPAAQRWMLASALAAVCLMGFSGCGAATAPVSGQVLLKGKPVPGAEIQLVPVNDASKSYRGISLNDGTYQVDYGQAAGLPLGKYRATVTVYQTADGRPLPEGEAGQALKASGKAIMRKYVLEVPVEKGAGNVNLDLDKATPEAAGA